MKYSILFLKKNMLQDEQNVWSVPIRIVKCEDAVIEKNFYIEKMFAPRKGKMSKAKMVDNRQLREMQRLAVLLAGVVNKAKGCASKLRAGFIEPIDADEMEKEITAMQVEVLQIDSLAGEIISSQTGAENYPQERDSTGKV